MAINGNTGCDGPFFLLVAAADEGSVTENDNSRVFLADDVSALASFFQGLISTPVCLSYHCRRGIDFQDGRNKDNISIVSDEKQ
jgi:hypothetical protein